jgi:hypothetical protein
MSDEQRQVTTGELIEALGEADGEHMGRRVAIYLPDGTARSVTGLELHEDLIVLTIGH